VVKASIDGMTARVSSLQPGEYLDEGQAAFALVGTKRWIEANPKETDLTWVEPGQPVEVSVDTYPGRSWHGTVESVSPASQAQFSLLPAQNTSGNWVKVVQRIPMRIAVEPEANAPPLRAGMSAEIEVDTGHLRHLRDLFAWL
jgi:membrane fusion protein (multidrug efflux system)